YALFGESIQTARLVGIIAGAATIILTFYAGRHWFSSSVGFLAAGFLAISPYFIGCSRFALTESDAFCPLTVLLMLLAFDTYLRRRDSKHLVIFSLTFGLALAAKFYIILIAPALVICDLLYHRFELQPQAAFVSKELWNYDPKQHRATMYWALSAALLIFLAISATQLRLVNMAIGLWAVGLVILLFGLRELTARIPGQRWYIQPATNWPPLLGWIVILLLAGSICMTFFPEHVIQRQVPRAFYRCLIRQGHVLPMVRFIDPARLYIGIILFKIGLPLGLLSIAALVWAWVRSRRDAILRLLMAVVGLYVLLLLTLPLRQTFYLMAIYPLLMLILAVFIVRAAIALAGWYRSQSAWIAFVITACLWTLWGDFRVYPEFGLYGYEIVGNRWLGAESQGYRNLIQVTNDGTEDALAWCVENVPSGGRVVSYLWDDHVIDAFVEKHPLTFELVRRLSEIDKQQGPPFDDTDYLILSLNNEVSYFDAPPMDQLKKYFDLLPAHMIVRGRGRYQIPVIKIYQRKAN
ncbi:MAG: glycosyltransferase family 39 protein, partial [Planctomycetota bacterium]